MVLTAYFVLSPATRLFWHRRLAEAGTSQTRLGGCTSTRLDAGKGASGPHDFAVRDLCHSSARRLPLTGSPPCDHLSRAWHCRVHRIPTHVRDDRETPLARAGWTEI